MAPCEEIDRWSQCGVDAQDHTCCMDPELCRNLACGWACWAVPAMAVGAKAVAQAAAPVNRVATRIVRPTALFLMAGFMRYPFLMRRAFHGEAINSVVLAFHEDQAYRGAIERGKSLPYIVDHGLPACSDFWPPFPSDGGVSTDVSGGHLLLASATCGNSIPPPPPCANRGIKHGTDTKTAYDHRE